MNIHVTVWSYVVDTSAGFYRNNRDIRKIRIFSLDTVSCKEEESIKKKKKQILQEQ